MTIFSFGPGASLKRLAAWTFGHASRSTAKTVTSHMSSTRPGWPSLMGLARDDPGPEGVAVALARPPPLDGVGEPRPEGAAVALMRPPPLDGVGEPELPRGLLKSCNCAQSPMYHLPLRLTMSSGSSVACSSELPRPLVWKNSSAAIHLPSAFTRIAL